MRWVGHVLRAEETYLMRKVLVRYVQDKTAKGDQLQVGSLMMDCPAYETAEQLIALAQDREEWNLWVNALKQHIIYNHCEKCDVSYN